jgi:hypothetical protein
MSKAGSTGILCLSRVRSLMLLLNIQYGVPSCLAWDTMFSAHISLRGTHSPNGWGSAIAQLNIQLGQLASIHTRWGARWGGPNKQRPNGEGSPPRVYRKYWLKVIPFWDWRADPSSCLYSWSSRIPRGYVKWRRSVFCNLFSHHYRLIASFCSVWRWYPFSFAPEPCNHESQDAINTCYRTPAHRIESRRLEYFSRMIAHTS